jgi:hypothetical protein
MLAAPRIEPLCALGRERPLGGGTDSTCESLKGVGRPGYAGSTKFCDHRLDVLADELRMDGSDLLVRRRTGHHQPVVNGLQRGTLASASIHFALPLRTIAQIPAVCLTGCVLVPSAATVPHG